jgi:uncharacterized protein (TIGR03790 family)
MRLRLRVPCCDFRVPGSTSQSCSARGGFLAHWLGLALFLSCLNAYADDALSKATLVVYNTSFPESRSLAEYYASKRAIPKDQVIGLACSSNEDIERDDYDKSIAEPLRNLFSKNQWWTLSASADGQQSVDSNRIRFIALIRGIPLKIRFKAVYEGNHPDPTTRVGISNEKAVDSELATLGYFRRQISGPFNNPYYRSFKSASETDPRLMFVARLDGPEVSDVRRMIDDALSAERAGLWGWTYVDARGVRDPAHKLADDWLFHIVDKSFQVGHPAILDRHEALFPAGYPMTDAILYFGWYSDQPAGVFLDKNLKFRPGAIAVHIHSLSGATVRKSDRNWVGPLIRCGVAATLGNVYEPFLELTPALDVFHDRLLTGMTFAESAYASLPCISWMTTIVGDPLYRPFPTQPEAERTSNPWATLKELFRKDRHDPAAMVRDLKEMGGHFPAALEVAALVEAHQHDENAALATLEMAKRAYGHDPERFRCTLDQAEILKDLGRADQLSELIHKALGVYTESAQQEILKSYLR